jgi:hypothetical protein
MTFTLGAPAARSNAEVGKVCSLRNLTEWTGALVRTHIDCETELTERPRPQTVVPNITRTGDAAHCKSSRENANVPCEGTD